MMDPKRYWDSRYGSGGTSGSGSIGRLREWKWGLIQEIISGPVSVIDYGCGDQSFWDFPGAIETFTYTGLDLSKVIVERNSDKFPDRKFIHLESSDCLDISADVVFCFDVLFHIMDDKEFENTLRNIFSYAKKMVFVSTWTTCPLRNGTDGTYQCYRDLSEYFEIAASFRFLGPDIHPAPDGINSLFVFRSEVA